MAGEVDRSSRQLCVVDAEDIQIREYFEKKG